MRLKIIYFVLIMAVFFMVFGIFPRVAGDYPFNSVETLKVGFNFPQTWTNRWAQGMGESALITLWSFPLDFLTGIGASLGLTFSIIERILGIIPLFILSLWSTSKLFNYLGIRGPGKTIATLFYLTNTYILLTIDGGQLQIGLAYALLPLAFLAIEKSLSGNLKSKLIAAMTVYAMSIFDIRFIYILIILFFLRFIYSFLFIKGKDINKHLISYISSGLIIIGVFIGLSLYWILPSLMTKIPALPETYARESQTVFLSFATLGHSMFLLQPHWYKNVFGNITPLRPEFVLIPILVFLAPILRKRSKEVGFWMLAALIGIFFVKGVNMPFSGVYAWFFTHVPGFSLFRDPTKFYFLIALSYSILIGITTDELINKFNRKLIIGNMKIYLIQLLFVLYFLLLISPIWLGKMTGIFSNPPNQKEYFQVADILGKDLSFSRVFWIPTRAPLGYSSPSHPSVEASRLVQKRPFTIGVIGSYETFNFIREAPFMGEIFKIAGVRYISYPYPDTRREDLKKDNIDYYYAFLDQISSLSWIEKKLSDPPVSLLQTKEAKDHFFVVPNTYYVVGSDRIYNELMSIPGFDLSNNALIFAEEKPSVIENLGEAPLDYIILYDKSETDLAGSLIDKSLMLFPAENIGFDPTIVSPWWKRETIDFLWFRNFLQEKYGIDNQDFDYGGGYAISEGSNKLELTSNMLIKDNILLARVMKSSRGGKISFSQGGKLIGEIYTKIDNPQKVEIKLTGYKETPDQISEYDKADFYWYEIGKLANNDQILEIRTEGDINIINALSSLNEEEWNHANRISRSYNVLDWNKLKDSEKESLVRSQEGANLSYQRMSPTHYKVKIEDLKASATLAFSETYDSLWQSNGKDSYPIYTLINGFRIDEDGIYNIYFSPQKYILPGLIVSGTCMVLITSLLILSKQKKYKDLNKNEKIHRHN